MNGLTKLAWIEFKLFLRDTGGAVVTLIFPMLLLILFGAVYGNEPVPEWGGYGLLDVIVPSLIGLIILMGSLFQFNVDMANDREKGILRRLKATPLRPRTILTSRVLRIFLTAVLGVVLLLLVGIGVFGLQFHGNILSLIGGFLFSCVSLYAFGFLLASIMPNGRTAEGVAMILFFVMIFFSGVVIPFESLPANVLGVTQLLPLTHVNNLLKGLWLGFGWGEYLKEVVVLLSIAVVGISVSIKTFRWE